MSQHFKMAVLIGIVPFLVYFACAQFFIEKKNYGTDILGLVGLHTQIEEQFLGCQGRDTFDNSVRCQIETLPFHHLAPSKMMQRQLFVAPNGSNLSLLAQKFLSSPLKAERLELPQRQWIRVVNYYKERARPSIDYIGKLELSLFRPKFEFENKSIKVSEAFLVKFYKNQDKE